MMQETDFRTSAERERAEAQGKVLDAKRADLAADEDRIRRENALSAERAGAKWEVENAKQQEAELSAKGRQRQAELVAARQRVELLQLAVERKTELQAIEREIGDQERALVSSSLLSACVESVARLNHLRALRSLWPAREAVLKQELADAEEQLRNLETSLSKITAAFMEAKSRLTKLLGKS